VQKKLVADSALELKVGPLFVSLFGEGEILADMFDFIAQRGILVRLFEPQEGIRCLRIGLTNDTGLERLGLIFDEWHTEKHRGPSSTEPKFTDTTV
ncbi:hypothetical protein, partial [Pseudomaricurvus sp.]|uniref:hypothetical protein n=1 Tax=Pseudomaricurvus sp. TaxID=2004510 RepID=UPI003F6D778E